MLNAEKKNYRVLTVKPIENGKAEIAGLENQRVQVRLGETEYSVFERSILDFLEADAWPIGMDVADLEATLFDCDEAIFFASDDMDKVLDYTKNLPRKDDCVVGGLVWAVNESLETLGKIGDHMAIIYPQLSFLYEAVNTLREGKCFYLYLAMKKEE